MTKEEIRKRFDEIVAFAEVEKFLDTPVKRYSSGMYVRLAFAVAAHLEPEILVVDEVLAVGDAQFQKKSLGKMQEVAKSGRTVLFVSHNMATVANLCDRTILLHHGQKLVDGIPSETISHYLSLGQVASNELKWADPASAPGNDIVRLHRVRVLQAEDDTGTEDLDISKETRIQIEFWNLKDGEHLYAAIWLRHESGAVVLSSGTPRCMNLTPDAWYGNPHPAGLYRAEGSIPANFLNEGVYSVTPIVGRGVSDTQILLEWALSFKVHDTGEMRKEYYGKWIGVIRPKLAWRTERLS